MKNQKLLKSQIQKKKAKDNLPPWFYRINIYLLVFFPLLMFLFLVPFFFFVGEKIYGDNTPESYSAITSAICILFGSLSGIFQIIRKEGPGPFGSPIYGVWPVITGAIFVSIFGVVAIILLYYGFYLMQ